MTTHAPMTLDDVTGCFTRADGQFLFARWGRPIAPIVFGVEDQTLGVIKAALQALAHLTGQELAETDPELGSNLMVFFFRDWAELPRVPDLDRLVPGLDDLVQRLTRAGANQYRIFRFDEAGAIRACFVFLRMDDALSELAADELALGQMAQSMLLWSESAFARRSALARLPDGRAVLRPDISDLLRVAYDPVLPTISKDKSHALRLHARLQVAQ